MPPAPAPDAHPPAWDTSHMATLLSNVANASASSADVVVHFGQHETREGGEAGVRLLQTLTLTPYSAKRLQELLAVLVREHDQRQGR